MSKSEKDQMVKKINETLQDIKQKINSNNIDGIKSLFESIEMYVNLTNHRKFEFNLFLSMYYSKIENYEKSLNLALVAANLDGKSAYPWKVYIKALKNISSGDISEHVKNALLLTKNNVEIISSVIQLLNKVNDDEITSMALSYLRDVDNYLDLFDLVEYFPESFDCSDLIKEYLEYNSTNKERCGKVARYYVCKFSDFKKAFDCIKHINDDDIDALYCRTLYSDDPIHLARKYSETGDPVFDKFIAAYDNNDLEQMQKAINDIDNFVGGEVYYAKQLKTDTERLRKLQFIGMSFPDYPPLLKLKMSTFESNGNIIDAKNTGSQLVTLYPEFASDYVEFLLKHDLINDLNDFINKNKVKLSLDPASTCHFEYFEYTRTGDKQHLSNVIKMEISEKTLSTIWDSFLILRDDLSKEENISFLEKIVSYGTENPDVYALYALTLFEIGNIQKAKETYKIAFDLGYNKPDKFSDELAQIFIEDNDIVSAKKVAEASNNYSLLGLIHYNNGNYEESAKFLAQAVRNDQTNYTLHTALSDSYIYLGKILSAVQVYKHLKSNGIDYKPLETSLFNVKGIFIDSNTDMTNDNPLPYFSLIRQTTEKMRLYYKLNRKETSLFLSNKIHENVKRYKELWQNLSGVQKVVGDYYLERYLVTNDDTDFKVALQCFMKRTESDKRPESFIDVAHLFFIKGQFQQSLKILKKAIYTFYDSSILWLHLGIAYYRNNMVSYARHCFCISSLLATGNGIGKAFICVQYIAVINEDMKLYNEINDYTKSFNITSNEVYQLEIMMNSSSYDTCRAALYHGSHVSALPNMPIYSLSENRLKEALSFSLGVNDLELINDCLESLGMLNLVRDTTDEDRIKRMKLFNDKTMNINKIRNSSPNDSVLMEIAELINNIKTNVDIKNSIEKLKEISAKHPEFRNKIYHILSQIVDKSIDLDLQIDRHDSIGTFLYNCRTLNQKEALEKTMMSHKRSLPILESYLHHILANKITESYEECLEKLSEFDHNKSLNVYKMEAVLYERLGKFDKASILLMRLSTVSPLFFSKYRSNIKAVIEKCYQ